VFHIDDLARDAEVSNQALSAGASPHSAAIILRVPGYTNYAVT